MNYVKNKEISLVKPAQQFQIPRNTIHRHVERKVKAYGCIFSPQQESVLKDRILLMCNRGFPLTISDFLFFAYKYAKTLYRRKMITNVPEEWTRDEKVSKDW